MLKPRNNYLEEILNNGHPCRWNKRIINVYIFQETVYEYKKAEIFSKILQALQEWQTVLDGKIQFHLVKNSKDADINIQYQRNECDGTVGVCKYTKIDDNGAFIKMDVCIGLIYSHLFLQDAMHEIGHALGLMGHSTISTDLMFSHSSYVNLKLSKRDRNTLRMLYSLPLKGEEHSIFSDEKTCPLIEDLNENIIEPDNENFSDEVFERNLEDECKKIGNINLYKLEINNINTKKYVIPKY